MPYVSRDVGGNVDGVVRWPHPDFPEKLSEDDPDLLVYLNPPPPRPEDTPTSIDDLVRLLKAKGLIADQDLTDIKRSRP